MIELPRAILLGHQINEALVGKTVTKVYNATSVNKFVFFNNDPVSYKALLTGRKLISAKGRGIFVDICFDDDVTLSICDGITPKFCSRHAPIPTNYQLLLTFDDETFLTFTVTMYGGLLAYRGQLENKYHETSFNKITPLSEDFTRDYFEKYLNREKGTLSLKAFLATEQRFPGIGNGVLQDILFNAGLHPKRKLSSLTDIEKERLYHSVTNILSDMLAKGGSDIDTDLFGDKGGYRTILSKNTYKQPCPNCGGAIIKENYMGGSIYYCPSCQPFK